VQKRKTVTISLLALRRY